MLPLNQQFCDIHETFPIRRPVTLRSKNEKRSQREPVPYISNNNKKHNHIWQYLCTVILV